MEAKNVCNHKYERNETNAKTKITMWPWSQKVKDRSHWKIAVEEVW